MESPELLLAFREVGVRFFCGVPDSLLADFCACVDDQLSPEQHVIAANEGNAVALAAGHYLATDAVPVVYLQNSGLGNCVNPLISMADPGVYAVPLVLLIGWRGEPEVADEPQHVKQGEVTRAQLDVLGIPYRVVDAASDPKALAAWAKTSATERSGPVALLVRKGSFEKYARGAARPAPGTLRRETAIGQLLELAGDALVVATTGKTAREVFELRVAAGEPCRDFLTVGSMGHASSIAAGVAIGAEGRRVVCLDGDGAALMHLGAMPVMAGSAPPDVLHVLLNNAAHESVGGQPTVADRVDWRAVALGFGYAAYEKASTTSEIAQGWATLSAVPGLRMLEVSIDVGSRADLGRPTSSPLENRQAFVEKARS